jgi:ethanolamine utilization microcompartment shell protein EutS
VPRIAVVQDGTELARQTEADVADCFERCCAMLSANGPVFSSRTFTDDTIGYLLEHIDPDEYSCLVLASNALISERVEHALRHNAAQLSAYLLAGGGIVVLHQIVESLADVLPADLCPKLTVRTSGKDGIAARAHDPEDLLLNFPATVSLDKFRDGGAAVGPPSLFYISMQATSLPDTLMPVLSYGSEVLLVRSYDYVPQRIVVAAMPLDWHDQVGLLANAIRFASLGQPRRLVWRAAPGTHEALLVRWLSMDGGASVHPVPGPGSSGIGSAEQWLLRRVDTAVAPADHLDRLSAMPPVRQFLLRGGTLLADDQMRGDPANKVVALVGKNTERRLATRLYGELRAVTGWDAVDYAFELRNIVVALSLLWTDPANHSQVALGPADLSRLRPLLRQRLTDPIHREDLSSSIAHVQSLAFLSARRLHPSLYTWMASDPRRSRFDVGLQIRAVTALATRQPDQDFQSAAARALRDQSDLASVAPVIRVLDAMAVLDQAGLLGDEPAATRDLAELIGGALTEFAEATSDGWLSVEATADAARGLVVLLTRLPAGEAALAERIADHLGAAMAVLRPSFRHYQANRKGVAWLARLTQAVVQAEREFPIDLRRMATLAWPEEPDDDQQATGAGLPLLEHLAAENKRLRDLELRFGSERLAARVGRGAATIGVIAIIVAPLAFASASVGFSSVLNLTGNTVLLTLLVGVIAIALTLLQRVRLLARPLARVLTWITSTVGPLAWLAGPGDEGQ